MRPEIPPQEWKCHHEIELESTRLELRRVRVCIVGYEQAIRKHRDQRGDDRCWIDDEELYNVLPEGYKRPERDTTVELELCKQFICNRKNPFTIYVSPQRRIEELERENEKLRERLRVPENESWME